MILRLWFFVAVLLFIRSSILAAEFPQWLRVQPDGSFVIDKTVSAGILHYDDKWRSTTQHSKRMKVESVKGGDLQGELTTASGQVFSLSQKIVRVSADEVRYSVNLTSAQAVVTNQVCLSFNLPLVDFGGSKLKFDDKEITLPGDTFKDMSLLHSKAKTVVLPLNGAHLVLSGDFYCVLQDNRKFKSDTFSLRLLLNPPKGGITASTLAVDIKLVPVSATPLNLRAAVNMGFADEKSGDGKGGWTDQGPENDLRMFKPGKRRLGGMLFDVIDPKTNNGKSCLVISDMKDSTFPAKAVVKADGQKFKYLYCLNAAGWADSPDDYVKAVVNYQDGSSSTFTVKGGRDVGNWWGCVSVTEGMVVWTGENRSTYVGLYLSKFRVEEKPLASITFTATDKAAWMLLAISGSVEDMPFNNQMKTSYIVAGKDWGEFKNSLEVEKGSVLDLSFLSDAPAGKYGRVIVADGKFAFEKKPQSSVRFYGCNLCFSGNYLEKKEAEELALRLVRIGYNSVRFHHHDRDMVKKKVDNSLTIDPQQLDKLDYLFYSLKKNGIYITTDVFVSRVLTQDETGLRTGEKGAVKALAPLSGKIMGNLKAFAKEWLTHVNPYTKTAWKDDPALFGISFINENTLYSQWQNEPEVKAVYEKALADWAKAEGITLATDADKKVALNKFITLMQIKSFAELKGYLKEELGCKALYTDSNMQTFFCQQLARNHYDYVDNHGYWDHPRFPEKKWNLPMQYHSRSVLPRYCQIPANSMVSRIFGKPFTFTEYNFVFPNPYRSEGNAVMGAYASLQGWDAVYRFAYSHNRDNIISLNRTAGFDVATDPLTLLGERIVSLFYLRCDVREAKEKVPFVITPQITEIAGVKNGVGAYMPSLFARLGLIHKTGSVILEGKAELPRDSLFAVGVEKLPAGAIGKVAYVDFSSGDDFWKKLVDLKLLSEKFYNLDKDVLLSDTGQIELAAKENILKVVTDNSEALVIPAGKEVAGAVLSVSGNTAYATFFAGAVDNKSLKDSSRILLLHLTDIKNTKTRFRNQEQTLMDSYGVLPHLVRKGSAEIKLAISSPEKAGVWAVDVSGKRLGPVESRVEGATLCFKVDTVATYGGVMAYEIILH